MEGDGPDVQVSVESSWNVLQGSLESCVTVVFLDPHTHDLIVSTSPPASEKLILVPPTDPVPCEISVKFQGRQCHVESFYSLSTARTCELYSHSKHEAGPDYICTVKGWIPYQDRGFSDEEGNEILSEEAVVTQMNQMEEVGLTKESMADCVISSGGFLTDALNHGEDIDAQKSVYSSGDDSWVDLKSNVSFGADTGLSIPELENWHVRPNEDELAHHNTHQDLFEAELELVDHSPLAALTIRLLSLQNRSRVEVDEMVVLAISGPVEEPISLPCPSSEKKAGSSLLFMFLPNMLQMARAVSDNSSDLPKHENRESDYCDQAEDKVTDNLATEDFSQSCEVPQDKVPSDREENQEDESCDQSEDKLVDNLAAEDSSQSCELPQDKVPSDKEEIDAAFLQNSVSKEKGFVMQGIPDLATHSGNSTSENSLNLSKSRNLEGDVVAKDLAVALEAFTERFDRLESLCLGMEAYLHRTFESLDQRLTHLEAQDRKGPVEAGCESVSLKHASTSINASLNQSHNGYQESLPPSMQSDASTDSAAISTDCKESISSPSAQSGEQGCSDELDIAEEEASLTHTVKTLMKEAPLESQEMSRAAATTVQIMAVEKKRPCASLDDAWASALSAFASSFNPVIESEAGNTVTDRADEQPLDSLILMSQECEPVKQDMNASNACTHTDDAGLEGDGPIYADGGVAHGDEQNPTAHVLPNDVPLNEPDISQASNPLNWFTSVSSDGNDLLDLKEIQSKLSKVRTVAITVQEAMDLAPSLSQDAPSAGPKFDVCTSVEAGSMVSGEWKDQLAALMDFNAGLSPDLDTAYARQSQNAMDFFECKARNSENFFNETCPANVSEAVQTVESLEEILCKYRVPVAGDLPDYPYSIKQGWVRDMNEVHDAISVNSTPSRYCEVEAAMTFPDVLDEDGSNYQDSRACSEDSLCFSQDFDTCQNDLCEDDWSCAPNVFYLNDLEFTDDDEEEEEEVEEADDAGDERLEMRDVSDSDSTEDRPFWPAPRGVRADPHQPTTVFPGFENLS